jgi:hypothetical protein
VSRIDQAEEAREWVKAAERPDIPADLTSAIATIAQVHATLALVEQQRITNRLMLAGLVSDVELRIGQHGARVGLLGREGVFHHAETPSDHSILDDDIREGLGL